MLPTLSIVEILKNVTERNFDHYRLITKLPTKIISKNHQFFADKSGKSFLVLEMSLINDNATIVV